MSPFDDPDSARTLIEQHAEELAAVVREPLPVSGAVNPPGPRLLVFDEMITGFRLGLGGASVYFGVTPDLVDMGKVLGGGLPIGAYGRDAQVMASVAVGDGSGPGDPSVGHVQRLSVASARPGIRIEIDAIAGIGAG